MSQVFECSSELIRLLERKVIQRHPGPIYLFHEGSPRYVLLTLEEYERLGPSRIATPSILDLLAMPNEVVEDFEIEKLVDGHLKPRGS